MEGWSFFKAWVLPISCQSAEKWNYGPGTKFSEKVPALDTAIYLLGSVVKDHSSDDLTEPTMMWRWEKTYGIYLDEWFLKSYIAPEITQEDGLVWSTHTVFIENNIHPQVSCYWQKNRYIATINYLPSC